MSFFIWKQEVSNERSEAYLAIVYISWSSDFALYLEYYLMLEHDSL